MKLEHKEVFEQAAICEQEELPDYLIECIKIQLKARYQPEELIQAFWRKSPYRNYAKSTGIFVYRICLPENYDTLLRFFEKDLRLDQAKIRVRPKRPALTIEEKFYFLIDRINYLGRVHLNMPVRAIKEAVGESYRQKYGNG